MTNPTVGSASALPGRSSTRAAARQIARPALGHVREPRLKSPRDVVTVLFPEYVVGHWWEQLMHNQSALRVKSRLLFQRGVMVISVPVPPAVLPTGQGAGGLLTR